MPDMTPQEIRERRKNAAARLAAGSAMIGGSAVAMHDVKARTGIKGNLHLVRDATKHGVKARHGKYAAGWLGTRGIAAAGLPLAVTGASNLLARKPQTEQRLNVRRDVIGESAERTIPGRQREEVKPDRRTLTQKITAQAPIAGGAALGGLAGSKLAAKYVPKGKLRVATRAVATGLGAAGGATAAVPITRHAVDVASSGTHKYTPHRGIYRKEPVGKAIPVILPKREQEAQRHRRHKAANLATASAGIGVTALGLRAPAAVKWSAARSKRIAKLPGVKRVSSWEAKATPASWNVGVLGTGVGSAAALNAARMTRTDIKAEEGKIKKSEVWINGAQHWIKANKIPKPVVRGVLGQGGKLNRRTVYRERKGRPERMYQIGPRPPMREARREMMREGQLRRRSEHQQHPPGITRHESATRSSYAKDNRGPGERAVRGELFISSHGWSGHTPEQTLTHETRHLTQPVSRRKGQFPLGRDIDRPASRATDAARRGKKMQMDQRSEAWADVGAKSTSGHAWTYEPSRALAYGRARRKMSTGILGKPDRMLIRNSREQALPLDDREMARLGRQTRTRYNRKVQKMHLSGERDRSVDVAKGLPSSFKHNTPKMLEGRMRDPLTRLSRADDMDRTLQNAVYRRLEMHREGKRTAKRIAAGERLGYGGVGPTAFKERHIKRGQIYTREIPWRKDTSGWTESASRQKHAELAKALFPTKLFRPKPARFAGVRAGGLRRVQTPTGVKTITYRGSMG